MAQIHLESQSLPVGNDIFNQQQTSIHQESQPPATMNSSIINNNQNHDPQQQEHQENHSAISTNATSDSSSSNELKDQRLQQDNNHVAVEDTNERTDNNSEKTGDDNNTEQSNLSIFSTAFTISFDDSSTAKKKLNIRDSIRKFAPPKPQTIENPNRIALATLKQNTEHSLMSIESAPAELTSNKHYTPTRNRKSASSVSSNNSHGRRANASSNHSSQSIVSDSAAFLIDKMLAGPIDSTPNGNRKSASQKTRPSSLPYNNNNNNNNNSSKHKNRRNQDEQLALDEIDFHDDRSDNGTYVVGADPDAEAARKRIDEIFGVAKTLDQTNETNWKVSNNDEHLSARSTQLRQHNSRSNKRTCDKPQAVRKSGLSKERQQHIDRLAYRDPNYRSSSVSRSSSSSQNQEASTNKHCKRHTRNLSCERTSANNNFIGASRSYRRSVSQSSRNSGGSAREITGNPDEDTRSSRSSMSNATRDCSDGYEVSQLSTHPNMKFNRAFALRRARLGIETPGVKVSTNGGNTSSQTGQQSQSYIEQLTKLQQNKAVLSPSFNREDGGRFSLRAPRAPITTNQLLGTKNRHQNSANESSMKLERTIVENKQDSKQYRPNTLQSYNQSINICPSASNELCNDLVLSPKSSTGMVDTNSSDLIQRSSSFEKTTNIQLGALDSLVISAISSLSQKIRHSVCDILIDQAKKLPVGNETRSVVEEILPQILVQDNGNKGPTTAEEIDRSLYFDLAKTLRNLKKVEQIVDVISMISKQTPSLNASKSSIQNSPVRASSATNSNHDNP